MLKNIIDGKLLLNYRLDIVEKPTSFNSIVLLDLKGNKVGNLIVNKSTGIDMKKFIDLLYNYYDFYIKTVCKSRKHYSSVITSHSAELGVNIVEARKILIHFKGIDFINKYEKKELEKDIYDTSNIKLIISENERGIREGKYIFKYNNKQCTIYYTDLLKRIYNNAELNKEYVSIEKNNIIPKSTEIYYVLQLLENYLPFILTNDFEDFVSKRLDSRYINEKLIASYLYNYRNYLKLKNLYGGDDVLKYLYNCLKHRLL